MSTSFHRPKRMVCNVAVAIFATALWASQVNAQDSAMPPYDENCYPSAPTEKQNVEAEWCSSHIGCRMVIQVADKTCKAVDFLRNIGKSAPSGQLTNEDVIEAATDDIPYTSTGQRIINNVRNAATKAYKAVGELIRTDDGQVIYAETSPTSGGLKSGTVISSNGTMARGQFDAGYRLHGSGQLITPDGKMRAGTFNNNRLNGEGFITEQDGNRIVLREGTFDGDTPVGEIVVSYADGSKVREIWENGRMVERGRRVPKGQIPPPVRRPQVELASAANAKNGLILVNGTQGRRYELWCKGKMVDVGLWSSIRSLLPSLPSRRECEPRELAEADDGPSKLKSSTARGPREYDDNRTPTINQLIAACQSEWLSHTNNGYYDQTGARFVVKFLSAPTEVLLNDAKVEAVTADFVRSMGQGPAPPSWLKAAQCYAHQTLNGRAGEFRTPTMQVKAIWDNNTQGRQDPL